MNKMKRIGLLISILALTGISKGQKINYQIGASSYLSSEENLPFWLVSNQNGRVPNENALVTDLSMYSTFMNKGTNQLDYEFGWSASGSIADQTDAILTQAYARLAWKKLLLSVGSRYEDIQFGKLSATNGNLFLSNNARPIPRISIGTQGYWKIPFAEDWLAVKGMYSEGIMLDDRYVDNTRVHYKNVYIRLGGDRKFNLEVGFQHYSQWGGSSFDPNVGKLPTDFTNYTRMIVGKGTEGEEVWGEWENAYGNHLGGWDFHVYLKGEKVNWELYRQTMFEDKSGTYFHRPDGVTGLYAEFKGEKNWVTSAMYENYYTRYQSGSTPGGTPIPGSDGALYTGRDNYFNNYIYKSGWTHYGRTLGLPFFAPAQEDENGHTLGVINNRIVAHHFGVNGYLFNKIPYRTLLTYSQNWGRYSVPFEGGMKEQVSALLELHLPEKTLPVEVSFSISIDQGELYKDNVGCFLRVYKNGIF
ncbi:capsule assembly Wzi family protein [Marinifilum sp.]|uniref:capsule assembly Wzi family protein n=1 Tax=Marinifilum sp. TaxID=2033137 RepID=UPI003BAB65C8